MRIENFFDLINVTPTLDIISKLNVGDKIRAKILNMTGNELVLKLFDGTILNATATSNINIGFGDTVELVLKDKINNRLFMETTGDNSPKDVLLESTIKDMLLGLGLKTDKENIEATKELCNREIPPDAKLIKDIVNAVTGSKNLTHSEAAFLISEGIAPNEKNTYVLNQLLHNDKIDKQIKGLMDSITNLNDKKTITIIAKGLGLIDLKRNVEELKHYILKSKSEIPDLTDDEQLPHTETITEKLTDLGVNKKPISKLLPAISGSEDDNKGELELQELMEYIKSDIEELDTLYNSNKQESERVIANLLHKQKQELSTGLFDNAKPASDNEDLKLIKNAFKNMFTEVKKEHPDISLDIKKTYKNLNEKLNFLTKILKQTNLTKKEDVLSQVDSIKDCVEFIGKINKHIAYMQIPINFFDSNTTGELYILKKDKKRRGIDPSNVTVFLSVNTKNLGQIESLIIIDKKNMSLNIGLEHGGAIDLFKESFSGLYNGLRKIGYRLIGIKYRIISEKINILNIKDVLKDEIAISSQTFDCKI